MFAEEGRNHYGILILHVTRRSTRTLNESAIDTESPILLNLYRKLILTIQQLAFFIYFNNRCQMR